MTKPWIIAFHAPIEDMDGFAPLGGTKGAKDAMRALYDSVPAAPTGRRDITGMDLRDADGEEVESKDVLLEDAARVLGADVPAMLSRGRQALAEISDAAANYRVDDFGRVA